MSRDRGIEWHFLVIEDDEEISTQVEQILETCIEAPDSVKVDVHDSFEDARHKLSTGKYDVIILDLKDEADQYPEVDEEPAGIYVFNELKKTRFTPVVFYTALAHKVRSEETTFVRVVEKTEGVAKLKQEVLAVMETRLPVLSRRVEEIQRGYMWDFVSKNWSEFETPDEHADFAYLLARRLALSLQREARKMARTMGGRSITLADPNNVHPMELYVRPPISQKRLAGDILKGSINGADHSTYWLVLTPSCDFEQAGRLEGVIVAECIPLESAPEYVNWRAKNDGAEGALKSLIGDNRQDMQSERYKFLPGTYFLPNLIVDFQRLQSVSPAVIDSLEVVSSLDSPFAEAVLARFSRYFGRLGTPDIDKRVILSRLSSALEREQAT
ncbi:hypothetical protein [Cerasicoccus maritimus]|uniref:hypothetical protein n=1 Tax=Cerasicoccus maritimus TaxID=490089 RepID=UPI0028526624|nr:hypothetical protein [Cerasicoccus maritimus]